MWGKLSEGGSALMGLGEYPFSKKYGWEEIDYYWGKLSADPKAEQCGWLKDKYGLSWQVVPADMDDMLKDKDKKKIARVTEAFLKMKKFDIAKLKSVRGTIVV